MNEFIHLIETVVDVVGYFVIATMACSRIHRTSNGLGCGTKTHKTKRCREKQNVIE